MSATLARLERLGVALRWNCERATLVIGAGIGRDRIALNLEMYPGGGLTIDGDDVRTAIADLFCGPASVQEERDQPQAIGTLSLIGPPPPVFVRLLLPPTQFSALRTIVARGVKLETVIVNVQGLTSEAYGMGVWDRKAPKDSPVIDSLVIVGFEAYSRAEEEPPRPEPDQRTSTIEQSMQRIEAQAAAMLRAVPWVIGLLAAILVVMYFRKG